MLSVLLLTFVSLVVMLLETGTETGTLPHSPGSVFLRMIDDLKNHKHPVTTILASIEYVAPLLQAAAIEFATELDHGIERIFSQFDEKTDALSQIWKETQKRSLMLERIVQNLSNGVSDPEWSQGSSNRSINLHQEYILLLQSSRSLAQDINASIQQISSLQSIRETQKSLQQADSVRR